MSEDAAISADEQVKGSKRPLIIGLLIALFCAGGGFGAAYMGKLDALISGSESKDDSADTESAQPMLAKDVGFIEIDPMVVSIGGLDSGTHLRFRGQLEVSDRSLSDVEKVMPRIVGVLNGYLRALDVEDFQEAGALLRIRSQMLRRVKVVVGESSVRDLLIMEFVVN